MGIELKEKAVNSLPAGSILFEARKEANLVGIVLKGKVEVSSSGMKNVMGAGTFAGIADVLNGTYLSSWRVVENASIFLFPASGQADLMKILKVNKDYPGLMVLSLARQIYFLWTTRASLLEKADSTITSLQQACLRCKELGNSIGHSFMAAEILMKGEKLDRSFNIDEMLLKSYLEVARVPADIQKTYYGACNTMAYRHVVEMGTSIAALQKECQRIGSYVGNLLNETASVNGCLLEKINTLGEAITASEGKTQEAQQVYESVEKTAKDLVVFLKEKTGQQITFDEEHWKHLSVRKSQVPQDAQADAAVRVEDIVRGLTGSLSHLIEYGGMEAEKAEKFQSFLQQFLALKDRLATDDETRRLRKNMTDLFYELYELVFLKTIEHCAKDSKGTDIENSIEHHLVDMFLNYGYISEQLLTKNQLVQLYHLADRQEAAESDETEIPVYTAKEWLTAIYQKEKEPSKNEFDMDFYEDLRDKKKSNHMSEEEEKAYLSSPKNRLEFEVRNMLRTNSRTVCAQVSSFVPFLFEEQLPGGVSRCYQSKEAVRAAMRELEELDYSIFYREVLYVNESKGIKREYIQKKVYPDVVMLPVAGARGAMWQEITGRKRDSAGRFMLPSFSDAERKDTLIPMYARFHWELCRTIQGASWNDIKVKSLTSEYSDYIQFYRKNKDLSEDRKEKVKVQLQKARNNTREAFVADYEMWIKNESQGAMRLNKVSRELLAMYCPFNREVRTNLAKQGAYDEAMARFNREGARKQKEFELRLRHIENEKGEITPELTATLNYYRDC